MKRIALFLICIPVFVLSQSSGEIGPIATSIAGNNVDSPAIWIAPNPENSLVFLTEKKGGAIMVFRADKKATFLKRIGGMKRPNGVAALQNAPFRVKDLLFVTDRDANRIHIYSVPDFQLRGVFGEGMPQPMGIALYQDNSVVYAFVVFKRVEGDAKVVRFRIMENNGQLKAVKEIQFGKELPAGQESIFVDQDRKRVFVADENERNIKVYSLDGKWQTNFGSGIFQNQVEGIVIARCEKEYIIATDQQSKTEFEFFDPSTYKHLATIRGKAANTDGIAITTSSLPDFPNGLFVAQSDPDDSGGRHAEFYDLNQMLMIAGLPSCQSPSTASVHLR